LIYEYIAEEPSNGVNLRYMGPIIHPRSPLWLRERQPPITHLLRLVLTNQFFFYEFYPHYQKYMAMNPHCIKLGDLNRYLASSMFRNHIKKDVRIIYRIGPFEEEVDILPLLRDVLSNPKHKFSFVVDQYTANEEVEAVVLDLNKLLDRSVLLKWPRSIMQNSPENTLNGAFLRWRGRTIYLVFVKHDYASIPQPRYYQALHERLKFRLGVHTLRQVQWVMEVEELPSELAYVEDL
jgi:hypothetical protein